MFANSGSQSVRAFVADGGLLTRLHETRRHHRAAWMFERETHQSRVFAPSAFLQSIAEKLRDAAAFTVSVLRDVGLRLGKAIQGTHVCNVLGTVIVISAASWLNLNQQAITAGSVPRSAVTDDMKKGAEVDSTASNTEKNSNSEDDPLFRGSTGDVPKFTGREALVAGDRMLADGEAKLEKVPGYTATFLKQERVGKSLTELQVINLKLMHKPLHIFMKWEAGTDVGQRVVFSPDENNGKLLLRKLTGLESRLGVIRLNPNGSLARQSARYPVSEVGLVALAKIIRGHRQKDLQNSEAVTAELREHGRWNGRDCSILKIEYATPKAAPDDRHEYRKCAILLDAETHLPVWVKCFGWPDQIRDADPQHLDETTLLEFYAYKDINFDSEVHAEDFSLAKLD